MSDGRRRRVYATTVGQDDNLGDSVLRSGLLRVFGPKEWDRNIYVGGNSQSYLSALGLVDEDHLFRDHRAFRRKFLRDALLLRKPLYVFNAGEVVVSAGKSHAGWALLALLLIARVAGAGAVHTGVGIRSPGALPLKLRLVLRICQVVAWRDEASLSAAGLGVTSPDWASYARDPNAFRESERRWLTVSMRSDREPPTDAWIEQVERFAERRDLDVIVLSQVQRDGDSSVQLASRFRHAVSDLWGDCSHAERLDQVHRIYAASAFVLSNRLHVLLIGAFDGARPIVAVPDLQAKVGRTLATTYPGLAVTTLDDEVDQEPQRSRMELLAANRSAFNMLHELGAVIRSAGRAEAEENDVAR